MEAERLSSICEPLNQFLGNVRLVKKSKSSLYKVLVLNYGDIDTVRCLENLRGNKWLLNKQCLSWNTRLHGKGQCSEHCWCSDQHPHALRSLLLSQICCVFLLTAHPCHFLPMPVLGLKGALFEGAQHWKCWELHPWGHPLISDWQEIGRPRFFISSW